MEEIYLFIYICLLDNKTRLLCTWERYCWKKSELSSRVRKYARIPEEEVQQKQYYWSVIPEGNSCTTLSGFFLYGSRLLQQFSRHIVCDSTKTNTQKPFEWSTSCGQRTINKLLLLCEPYVVWNLLNFVLRCVWYSRRNNITFESAASAQQEKSIHRFSIYVYIQ